MVKDKGYSIANLLNSATLCLQRGDLTTAYTQAEIGILETTYSKGPYLWSFHFIRAEVFRMTGRISEAFAYLQSLELTSDEDKNSSLYRQMHIGYCLALLGSHSKAKSLLEETLFTSFSRSNHIFHTEIKVRIAMLEFLSNRLDRADEIYQEILQNKVETIGWYLHCLGLSGRGKIFLHKKQYLESVQYLEAAVVIADRENAPLLAVGCQSEIALCLLALGDSKKALQLLRNSERVTWNLGALHAYSITLGDLGNVYLADGDYWTAIPYYQRALNLAIQIKDPAKIENWSCNIRLAYGKFRDSLHTSE